MSAWERINDGPGPRLRGAGGSGIAGQPHAVTNDTASVLGAGSQLFVTTGSAEHRQRGTPKRASCTEPRTAHGPLLCVWGVLACSRGRSQLE